MASTISGNYLTLIYLVFSLPRTSTFLRLILAFWSGFFVTFGEVCDVS